MTVGKRIREARQRVKLSQDKLGEMLGVTGEAVSRWERGIDQPRMKRLRRIADLLNVTESWLVEGGISEKNASYETDIIPRTFIKQFPLISWIEARQGGPDMSRVHSAMPLPVEAGENAFILEVPNDSMEPDFPKHSWIIVDPDIEPQSNSYVVVDHPIKYSTPSFRQLVDDAGFRHLKPINDRYPMATMSSEHRIIGVVVGKASVEAV